MSTRTQFFASEFRHCNILPAPLIDTLAGLPIQAIRLTGKIGIGEEWYQFERRVEIDFADARGDERPTIAKTCEKCGACCRNIPTHQIGIYMSNRELAIAAEHGHTLNLQGSLQVDGVTFHVLGVLDNGDCAMLGPHGCTLGDDKPLWCKIFHCDIFAGRTPHWLT